MRTRRIISLMLAIALIAAVAFSALFIISHADHECVGEDCPICLEMRVCLKALGDLYAVLLSACAVGYMIIQAVRHMSKHIFVVCHLSPVNLCDKMTA